MHIAPSQDNNRPQHQNPKHPANVASRVALARVKSSYSRKFNLAKMQPAPPGAIARAHEINREHPNTTFFTPHQSRAADRMGRHNNPLGRLGDKAERFIGLKQIAQQGAQMFNPTTRAGLINVASMFAGGPKGDASPMMGKLGMPGQFRDYGGAEINPLERGISHEGFKRGPGTGMRGIARRAKGVGGYRRANPLDIIEGRHAANSGLRNTNDMLKQYSNRVGFSNKTIKTIERDMGGAKLAPYELHDTPFEQRAGMDSQSHDYTDRMALLHLQDMMPGNSLLGSREPLMRALYDMLFSGKGFPNPPRRP